MGDIPQATSFEQQKWQDEVRLRTRELEMRELEAKAAIAASQRSAWGNPLFLAVLAAALAGLANLGVAWKTGADQLRNEEGKAESARILEGLKATDPDKAAQNLVFLLDSWLISDESRRSKLTLYLSKRKGGQGASTQDVASIPPASQAVPDQQQKPSFEPEKPPQDPKDYTYAYDFVAGVYRIVSAWLGGGHSQAEFCDQALKSLSNQRPDKTFKVKTSSEESRRDVSGARTYRYTCVIGL